MVKKICDCCGNAMDREVMFDAIIIHMGKESEIRWDICSKCSHYIAEFFEREFAYTQGRKRASATGGPGVLVIKSNG